MNLEKLFFAPDLLEPGTKPTTGVVQNFSHPLSRGLRRRYLFDGAYSNNKSMIDYASGLDGSIVGFSSNPWNVEPNSRGKSIRMTGVSGEYINLGDLTISGIATVVMWIYITGNDDNRIFTQSDGPTTTAGAIRYSNVVSGGHAIGVAVWPGSGVWLEVVPNASVTLNTWNHLAIVFDGTNATGYWNGVQKTSNACGFDYSGYLCGLGDDYTATGFGNNFNGRFQDLRIHDVALKASEIEALYEDSFQDLMPDVYQFPLKTPAAGRIMSSLVHHGGLAGMGGIAGQGGGLAG